MKSSCFNAMNLMTTEMSRGRARFSVCFHSKKKLCTPPSKITTARGLMLGDEACLSSVLATDYFRRTSN